MQVRKIGLIIISSLFVLLIQACYSSGGTVNQRYVKENKTEKRQTQPVRFFVDIEGNNQFQEIEISNDEKPQPAQGNKQWMMDFYSEIKYPASARNEGIGGLVVLEVTVNKAGKVEDVIIKKSVSKECDEEAKRAYLLSIKNGYSPLILNNVPVRFKTTVPVGFWLE